MSFINYLKEDLQTANIMAASKAMYQSDNMMKGNYNTYFKIKDTTYSFQACTYAQDEYDDSHWHIQMATKLAGNTEAIPEDKDVIKGFVEALDIWVKDADPRSFSWNASTLYPAYNKIAEEVSKKMKGYNFVNETLEEKEELADGIKREGNPVGRFIFSKSEPKEYVEKPEDWFEKKTEADKDTFEKYEKPTEVKPPKNFMTYLKPELITPTEVKYPTKGN
jgi:hypothetical protein